MTSIPIGSNFNVEPQANYRLGCRSGVTDCSSSLSLLDGVLQETQNQKQKPKNQCCKRQIHYGKCEQPPIGV